MEDKEEEDINKEKNIIINNDDINGNINEDMDDDLSDYDKKNIQEEKFDIPIYDNNIDKDFEQFGKMLGNENESKISEQKNQKIINEENKIIEEDSSSKKNNNSDIEELSNGFKMEDKLNENQMNIIKKYLSKEENNKEYTRQKTYNSIKSEKLINIIIPQDINGEDLYPLKQEKIFHRINQMKSLTVLEKEIILCHFIIEYKKMKKLDYIEWEIKIEQANDKLKTIKKKIKSGKMDFIEYKKMIQEELNYEQQLLNVYLVKDQASSAPQKDQIKKRINNRISIINKEMKCSIDDNDEEDEKKKQENLNNDEKLKIYVNLLLQQYLSAKEYFIENDFKEQEKDCTEKCNKIMAFKKKIETGIIKDNNININELPKSINPEYIYGYTSNERNSKFKEIVSELTQKKEEAIQKMNSYDEKFQKMKKKDFTKIKTSADSIIEIYQEKIDRYTSIIASIEELYKDKWVPAPKYCRNVEEQKIEKINSDIPANTMRIHIGKTDYDKNNVFLKVKLVYNNKKVLLKEVHLKDNKDFNETWGWKFDNNVYKNLFKNTLSIEMERSYWYKFGGSNVKGTMKIDLNSLKDNKQLSGDYKIELVSKRTSPFINISINLRRPFDTKQYKIIKKEVFYLQKIYPPFNPKSAHIPKDTNNIKVQKLKRSLRKKSKKIEEKVEKKEKNSIIIDDDKNNNISSKEGNDNDLLTQQKKNDGKNDNKIEKEDELMDIDEIDYINSLKVLEYELKILEEQISTINENISNNLIEKKDKISNKIKSIQQQMKSGVLPPKDYCDLLIQQIAYDQALFNYLKQENKKDKANVIDNRIKLMNEEIEECKKNIK